MHFKIIVIALQRGDRFTAIQKPISARPIQLNANIEQTIAATDARVATAFTRRMTLALWRRRSNSVQRLVPNQGDNPPR
jgi:hypothetical protein